jgi:hypothetical protein
MWLVVLRSVCHLHGRAVLFANCEKMRSCDVSLSLQVVSTRSSIYPPPRLVFPRGPLDYDIQPLSVFPAPSRLKIVK